MSLEFIEEDHSYLYDGRRVPGVSEILTAADVIFFNSFAEERKDAAADRGRTIHLACADLDRGFPDWWDDEKEIAGYIAGYQQFKKDFEFKPSSIEKPYYHATYRYCGTPDRFGEIRVNGGIYNVTLDLKATAAIGPHVPIQLGGYSLFCDDSEEREMAALQLKPNGRYKLHAYNPEERKQNIQVFLAALTMFQWKGRYKQ